MDDSVALQKKKSVEQAINLYESIVSQYKIRASRSFFMDLLITIIVPVIAVILAGFYSNITGIITTLGLGTINAGDKLAKGRTLLIKYWSDRSKLDDTVNTLKLENIICDLNVDQLNTLLGKTMEYLEALKKLGTAQQTT